MSAVKVTVDVPDDFRNAVLREVREWQRHPLYVPTSEDWFAVAASLSQSPAVLAQLVILARAVVDQHAEFLLGPVVEGGAR